MEVTMATDVDVDALRYNELVERALARIRPIGMEPYLDLGSETHSGTRMNRQYMDSISVEMRILNSKPASTAATLFGRSLKAPIVASALCESRILKRLGPWAPPYLEQIAAELARIVEQGAPVLHIVKPYADESRIQAGLESARSLGCVAVGMDVDAMYL